MASRHDYQQDIKAWDDWKQTGNKAQLSVLFKRMEPVIQKEVSRWSSGPVARPVINLEAKKLSLNAFRTFDPNKARLNTHLTNNLKGLSRIVYTHTNPARMPEHQVLKMNTFLTSKNSLEEQLGREPTTVELSEDLAWSPREVESYQGQMRTGYSTSQPVPAGFEKYDADRAFLDFVYNDLVDQDQIVFEHTTGYGGKRILSAQELIAKTGMTQGQISHSKRRIRRMIEEARGLR
tara:strand:- start:50969 stop:51673 length:705 start_codon:yes stop_codon:yes gene_type:complete